MATIKAYTDLSQSKKLAEILPLESADMYWKNGVSDKYIQCFTPFVIDDYGSNVDFDYDVPCWSLAALLSVLPKGYSFVLTKSFDGEDYYCKLDGKPIETMADNPVDACVVMIEKLNELKML